MNISQYRFSLLVIIPIISSAAYADVYKCKNKNGQVIYSGKPCSENAKKMKIEKSIYGVKSTYKSTVTFNGKPIEHEEYINEELFKDFIVTEDPDGSITLKPKNGDSVTYTYDPSNQ